MLKLLPTPIGNLQDITLRTIKELKSCEYIFCEDSRVTKRLLFLLNEKFGFEFGQKEFIPLHSHNETQQIDKYADIITEKRCVYMSDAGTPCISDPGSSLVRFCIQNSIHYEVLPGANALLPAFCASGFDDSKFLFYGFLPHKQQDRSQKMKELLSQNPYPVIFYESPHRLLDFLEDLSRLFPERDIFLAKEITKLHEKFVFNNAKALHQQLKDEKIVGEWVAVVNISNSNSETITMSIDDLMKLSLPKKELAKLISKITGANTKEIYETLL